MMIIGQMRLYRGIGCAVWISLVWCATAVYVDHERSLHEASKTDGLAKGHSCGLSHPGIQKLLDVPSEKVPQDYLRKTATKAVAQDGVRQLEGNDDFMPIQEAEEQGLTNQIRIRLLWDVIKAGDYTGVKNSEPIARQCNFIGEEIELIFDGSEIWTEDPCPQTEFMVNAKDSETSASERKDASNRFAVMKRRTEWAADYWEKTLRVKPVEDEIVLSSNIMQSFDLAEESQIQNDTDVVVIMTARPAPFSSVAGYASCLQRDQYQRCTVGQFNWIPDLFDVGGQNADNVIRSERHTAVHELTHILGGILVGDSNNRAHIDNNGSIKSFEDIAITETESADYPRQVTKIKTEKVLEIARRDYDCPTLDGVALEDVPLGKGAHWESRLLGPEFMSYGSSSGEVYISDLTLAFLADTNQYVVDFSRGGLLVEPTEVTFKLGGPSFLSAGSLKQETPPEPLSPGALTWGRGEGCAFLTESARKWSSQYRCEKHQEYGCTADNKNSAVCTLKTGWEIPRKFSCGEYDQGSEGYVCDTVEGCSSSTCPLPEMFQYFKKDELKEAFSNVEVDTSNIDLERLGGFSSSMDHVPIRVRFWNCRDQKAATNGSSRDGEEGGGLDISDFTGGILADMDRFGGQEHCKTCRCFLSSLRELTSFAFDPRFPQFGLCYRANCFRKDYLQVAVRNQLGGVNWYKCPDKGGKFNIAGFTGAFHCPEPKQFCRMEEISGIRYPETDPLFELVFFSVLGGILLIFICICCGPNWRNKMVAKTKRGCGLTLFFHHSQAKTSDSVKLGRPFAQAPDARTGLALLVLNTFMAGTGLSIFALAVYGVVEGLISTASIPLFIGGSSISAISMMGMISGRKPAYGPSCCAAVFYYISLTAVLVVLWFVGFTIFFPSSWDIHVEENIDVYTDMLPNSFDKDAETPKQAEQIAETLRENIALIIGIIGSLFVFYSINLVLLTKIISLRNVVAMNYTFMNNASWVMGLICTAVGISFAVFQGTFAGEEAIPTMLIAIGLFVTVTGVTGTFGAFKKSRKLIFLNLLLTFVVISMMIAVVVLAFLEGADIDATVDSMSEDEKREISKDMGFATLSDEELEENLRSNFRRFGMAFIVTTILFSVMFGSGILFAKYVKHWNEHEAPKDEMKKPKMSVPTAKSRNGAKNGRSKGRGNKVSQDRSPKSTHQ
eukprot:gb/GECG01001208.1/.p1 GENE.gb/GECG01001208.1/~~gb/GECG01001208.1/.p1  ORF type:complete len:1178 (+),score=114.14 gb/GECG01001208.1/:1-3534(+)